MEKRSSARMGMFGKSASSLTLTLKLWVVVVLVSCAKNGRVVGQLIIEVTNTLDNGSLDLTVSCPNIDPASYLLRPGAFHQWINGGAAA
ncbi:unnamed protein product [Sphenostylis stenocarpa]|uniref:Uncharacterized protein n=1 Tax=Sphenostylis stenocarpa TaxID=92480 RepID=A0AA86VVF5_9FABA|nr:unnamed protein product [Sphenostylis stenocarpa]